jgi:hypothetical protein
MRSHVTKVLAFTAVVELVTGLALLLQPATIIRWLLGADVGGSALGRFVGIALVALSTACWPSRYRKPTQALAAMLIYNALIAAYLVSLRTIHHTGGVLLWPVVGLHAAVAVALLAATRPARARPPAARAAIRRARCARARTRTRRAGPR